MSYYYANVVDDMIEYFEDKLKEREGRVRVISKNAFKSGLDGTRYTQYILAAEEGMIDSKYKL